MKRKIAARSAAIVMLSGLVGACSSEVQIQSTTTGGATGGASSSSSGTGANGGSSSSSSGTGGTGGGCSVSLPAGCGCPDSTADGWVQTFSVLGENNATVVVALPTLPIASDGSMVIHLNTQDESGNTWTTVSSRLVKLDAAGHVVWDRPADRVVWPTPDPHDCSTVFTGTIELGTTEVFDQTVSCSTASCPFVARIDAGGSLLWIKVFDFGGDGWTAPSIAGVLADGRIALVGPFQGTIDLGNGPLSEPPFPHSGVFVAMLSPSGDALWSRRFSKEHTANFAAFGVVSPAGDVTVATTPDGDVDFGAGPIAGPGPSMFGGLVLASYDASGALRFGNVIVSPGPTNFPALTVDSAGHLIVAEHTQGAMDFGGGPISDDPTASLTAVAAFDADGKHLWSTSFDASAPGSLAIDPADHVWIGGDSDTLVELDPTGALVAKHPVVGSGSHYVSTIGFTPSGSPVIAGAYGGTLDLGQGPVVAQSKKDAFVAKIAP